MKKISQDVINAWDNRVSAVVLTTVDREGVCNSVYATCVSMYKEEGIIIADNYFSKTRENIKNGQKIASVLFITEENKAYQIKGEMEYHTEGEIFDNMKSWNPEKHPGHAALLVKISEIYSGSEKIY
ncbi:pyridoxamine 5'-phosphate oxidase family protein [Lentisphaerota bacterium WC36G]|nr:pyridoxamine 5'-phosphate oxidase family protein [Lentisphaerae bacterium WC36]